MAVLMAVRITSIIGNGESSSCDGHVLSDLNVGIGESASEWPVPPEGDGDRPRKVGNDSSVWALSASGWPCAGLGDFKEGICRGEGRAGLLGERFVEIGGKQATDD